jgi:hypothetical protein
MERELLNAPVENLADQEFILGRASHFVNPAELLGLTTALTEHSEDLALYRYCVGPGVMQIAHGAPLWATPAASLG